MFGLTTIADPAVRSTNHAVATGTCHPFDAPLPRQRHRWRPPLVSCGAGNYNAQPSPKENFMRRITALAAAAAILASSAAFARPMPQGYYVIRWDNTGV